MNFEYNKTIDAINRTFSKVKAIVFIIMISLCALYFYLCCENASGRDVAEVTQMKNGKATENLKNLSSQMEQFDSGYKSNEEREAANAFFNEIERLGENYEDLARRYDENQKNGLDSPEDQTFEEYGRKNAAFREERKDIIETFYNNHEDIDRNLFTDWLSLKRFIYGEWTLRENKTPKRNTLNSL